jgi:hypothetical protein
MSYLKDFGLQPTLATSSPAEASTPNLDSDFEIVLLSWTFSIDFNDVSGYSYG